MATNMLNSFAATGDYSRPPGFTPLATNVDKTCSLPKATSVAHIMFISGLFQIVRKLGGKPGTGTEFKKNIRQQKS